MERYKLKETLKNIKDRKFKTLDFINPFGLAKTMLDYIGDTDEELRDDLILTTLWHWITNGTLATEEIHNILNISLDEEHLFYNIGQIDDSVFKRSFSVLVASICFSINLIDRFLSAKEVDSAFKKVIRYYSEEKDLRGYVNEKGWAHGVAHGADALGELAKHKDIGHDKLIEILKALRNKAKINNYTYINNEDERMVSVVVIVLERRLLEENEIIGWLEGFKPLEKIGKYPEDMVLEINIKNFLESLYFRLLERGKYKNIVSFTKECIKEVNSFL